MMLCFLFVGCSSSLEHTGLHEYIYSPTRDFSELKQYIATYEISDGIYTSLPYEYPYDIYSTYYSYLTLNALEIEQFDQIVYGSELLSKDANSLNSLYYICSLYEMNYMNEINPSELLEILNLFIKNGLYVLDYEDEDIFNHPDIIIYSIYLGVLCEDILQSFIDCSIDHSAMISWLVDNSSIYTSASSDESLLSKMNTAYQLYTIYSFFELDYSPFEDFLIDNFDEYASGLVSSCVAGDVYVIFEFQAYWDMLKITGCTDAFLENIDCLQNIIDNLTFLGGSYSLPQDTPNPLVLYIVTTLSQKYNFAIDYSQDIIPVIDRHRTYNNCYIPYTLFYSDQIATFYANQIFYLLDRSANYPTDRGCDFYSILSKESLTADELTYIDEYVDLLISDSEQELSYGNLVILSLLADKYLPANNDLMKLLENTISSLSTQISSLTISQNISLINSLYVYLVTFDQTHLSISVEFSSITPRNITEAYFFTRLLMASKTDLTSLPDNTVSSVKSMLDQTFNTISFSYSPHDTLRDMQSTYYGVFLSGYYHD